MEAVHDLGNATAPRGDVGVVHQNGRHVKPAANFFNAKVAGLQQLLVLRGDAELLILHVGFKHCQAAGAAGGVGRAGRPGLPANQYLCYQFRPHRY